MLIALTSAKGAPGVSTTALAMTLCWPRPVVLAELDPAGGDLLAGFGGGRATSAGLQELVVSSRRGGLAARLPQHLLALKGGDRVRVLPGLVDPAVAASADWEAVAAALSGLGDGDVDVVADCGRLRAEHYPLAVLARSERVVLVTRSTLPSLNAARSGVAELRAHGGAAVGSGSLGVIVVDGGRPYRAREIGDALGVPVVGVLPHDARSAAVLHDGARAGRLFGQSPLLRAARLLATELADRPSAPSLAPPQRDGWPVETPIAGVGHG